MLTSSAPLARHSYGGSTVHPQSDTHAHVGYPSPVNVHAAAANLAPVGHPTVHHMQHGQLQPLQAWQSPHQHHHQPTAVLPASTANVNTACIDRGANGITINDSTATHHFSSATALHVPWSTTSTSTSTGPSVAVTAAQLQAPTYYTSSNAGTGHVLVAAGHGGGGVFIPTTLPVSTSLSPARAEMALAGATAHDSARVGSNSPNSTPLPMPNASKKRGKRPPASAKQRLRVTTYVRQARTVTTAPSKTRACGEW